MRGSAGGLLQSTYHRIIITRMYVTISMLLYLRTFRRQNESGYQSPQARKYGGSDYEIRIRYLTIREVSLTHSKLTGSGIHPFLLLCIYQWLFRLG